MGLLRTILGLIIVLILVHAGLVYVGITQPENAAIQAIYGLGVLLESPATFILVFFGGNLPGFMNPDGFFTVALTAALVYFVVYLLLGFGRK